MPRKKRRWPPIRDENLRRAQARALKLLSIRDRTEQELRNRLTAAGFDEAVAEETVVWCRNLGYVDDGRFARNWVEHRLRHSPCGRLRLEHELREKGVADDVIAETLESLLPAEEEQRICAETAQHRARRLTAATAAARERRLAAFLARRGFSWDHIRSALAQVDSNSDTDYNTGGCT